MQPIMQCKLVLCYDQHRNYKTNGQNICPKATVALMPCLHCPSWFCSFRLCLFPVNTALNTGMFCRKRKKKKSVFLWHSGNIKWDDAYITSGRFDSSLTCTAQAGYSDSVTSLYHWLTRRLHQTHPQHLHEREAKKKIQSKVIVKFTQYALLVQYIATTLTQCLTRRP